MVFRGDRIWSWLSFGEQPAGLVACKCLDRMSIASTQAFPIYANLCQTLLLSFPLFKRCKTDLCGSTGIVWFLFVAWSAVFASSKIADASNTSSWFSREFRYPSHWRACCIVWLSTREAMTATFFTMTTWKICWFLGEAAGVPTERTCHSWVIVYEFLSTDWNIHCKPAKLLRVPHRLWCC